MSETEAKGSANFDHCQYINDNILPYVTNVDAAELSEAWKSRDPKTCTLYGNDEVFSGAKFWSNNVRSPASGFWWIFTLNDEDETWSYNGDI